MFTLLLANPLGTYSTFQGGYESWNELHFDVFISAQNIILRLPFKTTFIKYSHALNKCKTLMLESSLLIEHYTGSQMVSLILLV
jgi:hypothetical protein